MRLRNSSASLNQCWALWAMESWAYRHMTQHGLLLLKNKNIDGSDINAPQFPSCLKWIADNQLPHGSWGDDKVFLAHDRLINTLACIVALKSWDAHLD